MKGWNKVSYRIFEQGKFELKYDDDDDDDNNNNNL
jgi:hypothetical protein